MNVAVGCVKLFTWCRRSKNTQNSSGDVGDNQVVDIKKKVSFDLKNTKYIPTEAQSNDTEVKVKDQSSNTIGSILRDQKFQEVMLFV